MYERKGDQKNKKRMRDLASCHPQPATPQEEEEEEEEEEDKTQQKQPEEGRGRLGYHTGRGKGKSFFLRYVLPSLPQESPPPFLSSFPPLVLLLLVHTLQGHVLLVRREGRKEGGREEGGRAGGRTVTGGSHRIT